MDTNILVDALLTDDTTPASDATLTAYQQGWHDYLWGLYNFGYDGDWASYLRGHNDAWAKQNKRNILR